MKKKINVFDYSEIIMKALPKGILLNTNGDKFNTMVIGWGGLGINWSLPVFTVYVREGRYTNAQLQKTGEFTISVPLNGANSKITSVCGLQSGKNIDKVKEAGLTLEKSQTNHTPGVKEYPLTIECKVLYSHKQKVDELPKELYEKMYPQDVSSESPLANRDTHILYIGQIVDAYLIED